MSTNKQITTLVNDCIGIKDLADIIIGYAQYTCLPRLRKNKEFKRRIKYKKIYIIAFSTSDPLTDFKYKAQNETVYVSLIPHADHDEYEPMYENGVKSKRVFYNHRAPSERWYLELREEKIPKGDYIIDDIEVESDYPKAWGVTCQKLVMHQGFNRVGDLTNLIDSVRSYYP